ncbi:FUSC family protein [Desulfovibrio sp. OttesenSCG-928-C06]|nr:FUSC family protein [Desulfovibrio sp. OttesenSCG-928-C06]
MHALLFLHIRHALKTGIACVLAYWISNLLQLQFALWAVISTIIAMQGLSVADSVQHSLMRFSGMAIGAVIGMGLLLIAPDSPILLGVELFVITALGAYLMRYGLRYMLASTAMCIMLLGGKMMQEAPQAVAGMDMADPLIYGLILVAEVAIGVACALLVSVTLWPVRLGDTLRDDLNNQLAKCADLLDRVVENYLDEQQHLSYKVFEALSLQTWSNHERMTKVRTLEAHIFRYEHKGLRLQVKAIDRCIEALRALLDSLNEYDEEPCDPMLGPEIRSLADSLIAALHHLAGEEAYSQATEIVRAVTDGVGRAEQRLGQLRKSEDLSEVPLHRVLQLYSFYQTLRHLSEELLLIMHNMRSLAEKPVKKRKLGKRKQEQK